jgi:hypothetical protein
LKVDLNMNSTQLNRLKSTQVNSRAHFLQQGIFGVPASFAAVSRKITETWYMSHRSRTHVTAYQNSRNCFFCAVNESGHLWGIWSIKLNWSHLSRLGSQPESQYRLGLTRRKSAATSTLNGLESEVVATLFEPKTFTDTSNWETQDHKHYTRHPIHDAILMLSLQVSKFRVWMALVFTDHVVAFHNHDLVFQVDGWKSLCINQC